MIELHNIDCLKYLKTLEDNAFDACITSPPYNMRLRVRDGQYTQREKSEHFSKKYKFFDDSMPINDFYKLHKEILYHLKRTCKIVIYNFGLVTGSKEAFFKIIGDFSPHIKDIIIWDKGHGEPAMGVKVLNSSYELILIIENDNKKGRKIQNANFSRGELSNIIRVGKNRNNIKEHKAGFPVKLTDILVNSFTKKGDKILDPFCGGGTTGVSAITYNRDFTGLEICEEYYNAACKRLKQHEAQLTIF